MDAIFINTVLAFFEGLALILSPCILPILPIILAGSLTGSKARPRGIILGFILAFSLFTLFARTLVVYAHIDSETLKYVSYGILISLGVVMMSSYLSDTFNRFTSRLTGVGQSIETVNSNESGFGGGLLFGALIGIIWTPCAGPILAAVIVQSIVQSTTLGGLIIVSSFALGAAVPMFLIANLGRDIMHYFSFIRQHTRRLRQLLGLIIVLSVVYLIYSANVVASLSQSNTSDASGTILINGIERPYPVPAIGGISSWINSKPIEMSQLRGKVVLIDFWTYSCINCLRTLPYLKDWYQKYHANGFEVIGIHSPEFDFGRDAKNVKNAVQKLGIHYPVALDNNFRTWQNFHNQYWPAHYLVDKNGNVVYEHFGEGEYDVTENNIRYLLGLGAAKTAKGPDGSELLTMASLTPETYLGYARMGNFSSRETPVRDKTHFYTYPLSLTLDHWALQGNWVISADKIHSVSKDAAIKLHFRAGEVYAVMGSAKANRLQVIINGKSKIIPVSQKELYTVVKLAHVEDGTVELIAKEAGLEMYTFTFGG